MEKNKFKLEIGSTKTDYLTGIGYDITNKIELNLGMATNKNNFKDNELYIGASYNMRF